MTQDRPSLPKLTDLVEDQGPGLFTDARAEKSFNQAFANYVNFAKSRHVGNNFISHLTNNEIKDTLLNVCRYYWSDFDYEGRIRRSKIKKELGKISDVLTLATDAMNDLSPVARRAVNMEIAKNKKERLFRVRDRFTESLELQKSVASAVDSFVEYQNKRAPNVRKTRACKNLIFLWQKISKNKVFGALDTLAERSGDPENSNDEFVNTGPQFVLSTMRAIDSEIDLEDVRNGLNEARSAQRKNAKR